MACHCVKIDNGNNWNDVVMLGDGMISDGEQVQWQCMIMWCRAFKVSSLQHSFFIIRRIEEEAYT